MSINAFRKAVNAGRKNLAKVKTISDPIKKTFYTADSGGKPKAIELECCLKAFSMKDLRDLIGLQFAYDDEGESIEGGGVSGEVATLIIGIVESDGKRIFSEDDADLLTHPLNATVVLELSAKIIANAGTDTTGEFEVK